MKADGRPGLARHIEQGLTIEEARLALDRLLADPHFRATERNKRFLRFVAEELFQGREKSLKAYAIAVDVLSRPESFDPSRDPIVRIEATRLRAALASYYAVNGDHAIQVDLPAGGYVPRFRRVVGDCPPAAAVLPLRPAVEAEPGHHLDPHSEGVPSADRTRHRRWGWAAACVVPPLAAAMALLEISGGADAVRLSAKPLVSVEVKSERGPLDAEAGLVRDSLVSALSRFQTMRMDATAVRRPPEAEPSTNARVMDPASTYRIVLDLERGRQDQAVAWQMVDGETEEVVDSGTERIPTNAREPATVRNDLVAVLATRFGGTRGVVNVAETRREMVEPSLGYGCVLRSIVAINDPYPEVQGKVRTCLEETLALRPDDVDVNAALASVLLRLDPAQSPTELSTRALALANKAAALDPRSDRAAMALMLAQFRNGRIDAAVASGYLAMDLNPYNGAVPASLGAILFLTGRWDEGIPLVIKAGRIESPPYREAELTRAMDDYRRGNYDQALSRLTQLDDPRCYCTRVLRAATLGQLGRAQEAAEAVQAMRLVRPNLEASFRSDMAAMHIADQLTASLEEGLEKAGVRIQ